MQDLLHLSSDDVDFVISEAKSTEEILFGSDGLGDTFVTDANDVNSSMSMNDFDDILNPDDIGYQTEFISPGEEPNKFRRDIPLEQPPSVASLYPRLYEEPPKRTRMHKVPLNKHKQFKHVKKKKLNSDNSVANAIHNVLISSPVNNGGLWETLNRVLTFTASKERRKVPHIGTLDLVFPIAYLLPDKSCFICLVCRVSKKGKAALDSTYVLCAHYKKKRHGGVFWNLDNLTKILPRLPDVYNVAEKNTRKSHVISIGAREDGSHIVDFSENLKGDNAIFECCAFVIDARFGHSDMHVSIMRRGLCHYFDKNPDEIFDDGFSAHMCAYRGTLFMYTGFAETTSETKKLLKNVGDIDAAVFFESLGVMLGCDTTPIENNDDDDIMHTNVSTLCKSYNDSTNDGTPEQAERDLKRKRKEQLDIRRTGIQLMKTLYLNDRDVDINEDSQISSTKLDQVFKDGMSMSKKLAGNDITSQHIFYIPRINTVIGELITSAVMWVTRGPTAFACNNSMYVFNGVQRKHYNALARRMSSSSGAIVCYSNDKRRKTTDS